MGLTPKLRTLTRNVAMIVVGAIALPFWMTGLIVAFPVKAFIGGWNLQGELISLLMDRGSP